MLCALPHQLIFIKHENVHLGVLYWKKFMNKKFCAKTFHPLCNYNIHRRMYKMYIDV